MVICVKNTMSFGSLASIAISSNRFCLHRLELLEPGRIGAAGRLVQIGHVTG